METTGPKISSWHNCISGVTPVRIVGLKNRRKGNAKGLMEKFSYSLVVEFFTGLVVFVI